VARTWHIRNDDGPGSQQAARTHSLNMGGTITYLRSSYRTPRRFTLDSSPLPYARTAHRKGSRCAATTCLSSRT
jgi:hypothetical protein